MGPDYSKTMKFTAKIDKLKSTLTCDSIVPEMFLHENHITGTTETPQLEDSDNREFKWYHHHHRRRSYSRGGYYRSSGYSNGALNLLVLGIMMMLSGWIMLLY